MPISQVLWHFSCLTFHYITFCIVIYNNFPSKLKKTKIIIFSLLLTFLLTGFNAIFLGSTMVFLVSILNTLLILIGNLFIFKFTTTEALNNCALYVIVYFCLNIISYLLKLPICYNILKLINMAILITLLYKITSSAFYYDFIIKVKASSNNFNEISILLFLIILSCNFSEILSYKFLILTFTSQILVLIYNFYILKRNLEINEMNIRLNTLVIQIYSMQNLVDKVRTFKHDYNNTLCALGGYISLNDMNGLKGFYSRLNYDMCSANNLQLININNINDPSIYNILCSKHKTILKNNIKFNFFNSINYKDLSIPSYDLSKVLGILLDNAIEAALISPEREISLNCKYKKNNFYQIIIKNSYVNKDIDIKEIFKKGFSSKKVKSGLGLWEVSNIIGNFPNVSLITEKDDTYFTQTLKIPAK